MTGREPPGILIGVWDEAAGIVINPAGLTSCGYSLLDAVRDTEQPFAVDQRLPRPQPDADLNLYGKSAAGVVAMERSLNRYSAPDSL